MRSQRWVGLILALLCWSLMAPLALAQSQSVIIDDQAEVLDDARVTTAAQPLVKEGAQVVVITVQSAGGDGLAYLNQRLRSLGIASDTNNLPASTLVYYVAMDDRLSYIYGGSQFRTALADQVETLRQDYLNPGLAAGNPTRGFVDVLQGTAKIISNPVAARTESSDSGSGSGLIWLVALVAVGALAFFVVPSLLNRRSQSKQAGDVLAQTRARFDASRKSAGAAIADLGRQMEDASAKQKFDSVSYPSTQAQELARRHTAALQKFRDIQVKFDDVEERMAAMPQPRVIDLEAAAGAYDEIKQHAQAISADLNEMDVLRKELDKIAAQVPQEVDRAKKS